MFQSNNHPSRSRTLPMLLTATLGVAVAGVFACSDSPMQVGTDELAPLFAKGGGKGPPPPATVRADLVDQIPGVTGDAGGSYTGAHVTDRVRLKPQCDDPRRDMSLTAVDLSGTSVSLTNQSTCNGGADSGWVLLHLPDLLDTADCDNDCPFQLLPSFEVKGKNKILKATGAFAPTAHYFVLDLDADRTLDFVFQDAKVVTNPDASKTFTASEAHLYVAHSFVCEGGSDSEPKNIDLCTDIAIGVNMTATP